MIIKFGAKLSAKNATPLGFSDEIPSGISNGLLSQPASGVRMSVNITSLIGTSICTK
jgi:hypothetical protein